jgi:hypothetical protein
VLHLLAWAGAARLVLAGSEANPPAEAPRTFALETFARRSLNYFNRMVDTNGLPYFNIFWTEPAEAAHDWPDFGDVMSRQFQAAIMARHMTGERAPSEAIWRRKLLGLIDAETGLLTRPQTAFSQKVADPGDQALTLYALVTAYEDAPEESLRAVIRDVERVVRNQLTESQATDLSWLKDGAAQADTGQFTWRDLAGRLAGGFAGWTSPTHFLAACETLHWGGPELRGKTRAFQNCCGGSGTHGFFIAWKNAASFENGALSVNMHFDKLLPQAEIRGYQPFQGLLTIKLRQDCAVRARIPESVEPGTLKAEAGGAPVPVKVWGNYAELGRHPAGTTLKLTYPLASRTEDVQIGNAGFRHYRYRVLWRGDTVLAMEPMGTEFSTGYSDFEKKEVPVFYGKEGPGPLYQRAALLKTSEPELTPLQMDDGKLNFWAALAGAPAQQPSSPDKP